MNVRSLNNCPFCAKLPYEEILAKNETFFAKFDLYPVSPGHILLIPKRHILTFFQLTEDELLDFHQLLKQVRTLLNEMYCPDGFNIGVNNGDAAGQTISHLHIHIIPRYIGDVEHPEGGIRNIIPNLVRYPV